MYVPSTTWLNLMRVSWIWYHWLFMVIDLLPTAGDFSSSMIMQEEETMRKSGEKLVWDYRRDLYENNIRSHCRDFINSVTLLPMHSRFYTKLSQSILSSVKSCRAENFWRLQFWRLQTLAIATHRVQFAFIYDDFRWHANARQKYVFDGNSLKLKCQDKMRRRDPSNIFSSAFLRYLCHIVIYCIISLSY